MKSINSNVSVACLVFNVLTHGINGIPHSLPNCHESYWDPPISSLTGGWDSPILTRGLWDSPCPSPPFSEGFFFFSYPSGYLFWSLWHSKALFTGLTSAIPRGISIVFQNSFLRGIHNPFLLRGIIQSFSNGLTQISTRIFKFPLSPRN